MREVGSLLRLWLLCCGVMFVAAQGYSWASQQAWFGAPHLSLPWLILAGMGLAIASNRAELRTLTVMPPRATLTAPPAMPPTATSPETTAETTPPVPAPSTEPSLPLSRPTPGAKGKSISFAIHPPHHRQS